MGWLYREKPVGWRARNDVWRTLAKVAFLLNLEITFFISVEFLGDLSVRRGWWSDLADVVSASPTAIELRNQCHAVKDSEAIQPYGDALQYRLPGKTLHGPRWTFRIPWRGIFTLICWRHSDVCKLWPRSVFLASVWVLWDLNVHDS